jgi:1,4-dihydroxy-2-naphthoate octaprenyltransferase
MIGGTYYVTAGTLPSWVWLATIPYALSVMTVLIGKHVDKYEQDSAKGIHTLPGAAREADVASMNEALMIAFYPIVGLLVLRGDLGWGVLLVAFAIPRLRKVLKVYNEPKPATAPEGFLIWPLWYVAIAFYHNRLAGGLFVLGLVVNLILGLHAA